MDSSVVPRYLSRSTCLWVHYQKVGDSNSGHATRKTEEASVFRGRLQKGLLERHLLWLRVDRRFVRHVVFRGTVEFTDGIRLHLPGLERHGDLALAFAELLGVCAADERALDVDVVAFPQL